MTGTTSLQAVADAVVQRAQRQGFVVPHEIDEELSQAGLADTPRKALLALAKPSLRYRHGRYYYAPPGSDRRQQEQQQLRAIHRAIRNLIRQYKAAIARTERRERSRTDFIQPIKVETEDQRVFTFLSRDVSKSGIRILGTRSLLGQKVRIYLSPADGGPAVCLLVRILWTCGLGDELFENGGTFLEMVASGAPEPRHDGAPIIPV